MPSQRAYHVPKGDPCERCKLPASLHLVEHYPKGDPCEVCGLDPAKHRRKSHRTHSQRAYYAGIDGEGQGREDHRYVMLAWSSEDGSQRQVIEAPEGGRLTSVQCLDFILATPNASRLFAFAYGYDITKILTDLPDEVIYRLMRPETRQSPDPRLPPRALKWNAYTLNFQAGKFTVAKNGRRRVVWDTFKFFQSKFTTALEDWFSKEGPKVDIGKSPRVWEDPTMAEVVERMIRMKEQRAEFDKLTRPEILTYCYDECRYMARLARKLTEAHRLAGLKLRSYYGAGSTASAVLKLLQIDRHKRETPKPMVDPVARAFFGGRFENAIVGPVTGDVWSHDISSAYPYQLTFLPCLECGQWERTKRRQDIDAANVKGALVRYTMGPAPAGAVWGPFPFRMPTGAIAFPSTSGGGWVWGDEFKAGERHFPNVQFREAFVYRCECSHRPFARIPQFYLERLRIGKEGPGIVLKLGINAVYGKLAQSIGRKPPFACWIWAGMITSGTRAQILEMLGLHRDRGNLLMVATDGIYTREKLTPPPPLDTGTDVEVTERGTGKVTRKPLGGWETKQITNGVFVARPGIYFPLNPSKSDIKVIRARGVGRAAIWENWRTVVDGFAQGLPEVKLNDVSRFIGAKSGIGRYPMEGMLGQYRYKRHPRPDEKGGGFRYGQWEVKPVKLDFNPLPKREHRNPDNTLAIRAFPGKESAPYRKLSLATLLLKWKMEGPEAVDVDNIKRRREIERLGEQPDGMELSDYETHPE